MQKIGNLTNTADPQGEFTDGSVAQGIPPTILPASIFNTWQREMISVVEGAGMVLDPQNYGQLLEAVKSLNEKNSLQKKNNLSEIATTGTAAQIAAAQLAARTNIGLSGVDTPVSTVANATSALKSPNGLVNIFVRNNKDWGAYDSTGNAYIPLPLERGGLGATTKAGGRAALDLLSAALRDVGVGANQIPDMSYFTSLLATNGWFKLPSGYIVQMGVVNIVGGSGAVTTSYPITFPTACTFVTTGPIVESTTFIYFNQVIAYTLNSVSVSQYSPGSGNVFGPRNDVNTQYLAIGY